ncbi:hypothetical protein B0H16DRAFT_1306430, partial [Mycena metata]
PGEVKLWVKNTRKGTPKVDVESFSKKWWDWWTDINPAWWVKEGKLTRDEEGEGEDSWDVLRILGQNGLLNVVVCLRWWRVVEGKDTEDWIKAVEDVRWVLQRMVG